MKSLKTYIPSLILSIVLVFTLIGASGALTAVSFANPEKLIKLTSDNNITSKIQTELESYYSSKYNETGIPAEIYTTAFTDDYITEVTKININAGFNRLNGEEFDNTTGIENSDLESSIETFFNDYAESIDYVKDDQYYEKLQSTIDSAYSVVADYCDVFKFSAMENEGILAKLSKLYVNLDLICILTLAATLFLFILTLIINIKGISAFFYWLGVSGTVSGILSIIPCIYLKATNYFDAFTIKQSQIFTSFTSLMYGVVNRFLTEGVLLLLIGIVMLVLFGIITKKRNKKEADSE
ncbi:MAG: hypothetical protein LUG91_01450 [Ruminococcus sp.]|nr:hypothetical protein [Ruminococcus sp.]